MSSKASTHRTVTWRKKEEFVYRVKQGKVEDPCFGMPKEFFVFWYNTETGEVCFTADQSDFIEDHYLAHPDRALLFVELYDIAAHYEKSARREAQKAAMRKKSEPGPRIEVSERKVKRHRKMIVQGKEESVADDHSVASTFDGDISADEETV